MKKFLKLFIIILLLLSVFGFSIFSYYKNKDLVLRLVGFENQNTKNVKEEKGREVKDFSEIVSISEKSLISIKSKKDEKIVGVGLLKDESILVSNIISDKKEDLFVIDSVGRKSDIRNYISDRERNLTFSKLVEDFKNNFLYENSSLKLAQDIFFLGFDNSSTKIVKRGIISKLSSGSLVPDFDLKDVSGGILFSQEGNVIGILNSNNSITIINETDEFYTTIKNKLGSDLKPGYLGVGFVMKNLKDYINKGQPIGPIITGVVLNSPASNMGLRKDDILISINGQEFESEESLENFISQSYSGDEVLIKVYRSGSTIELKGNFGEKLE